MDQATLIETRKRLMPEQRAQALGENGFMNAYDLIYGMAEAVYTKTGGVDHQLIGIDLEGGKPTGVSTLRIRRPEDVQHHRTAMIDKWPLVAHVLEAWTAPDQSVTPPSAHSAQAALSQT
jgi:hypothetical protein